MSAAVQLPFIGEGVHSADIAAIHIQPGDKIDAGQILMELETDKAVVELPAETAGVVDKLLVKVGDSIKVGQPLFTLAGAGSTASKPAAPPVAATPAPAAPASVAPPLASPPAAAASGPAGKVVFTLPPLGEGVKTADVAEVIVKVGDVISADQTIMELETDKAVMELPCPHAGKVTKVLVSEGDTVAIGAPILELESSSPATTVVAQPAPAAPKSVEAPAPKTTVEAAASVVSSASATVVASNNGAAADVGSPVPAAPSTRRLARELGVDLKQVRGTGAGGRITAEDVQGYVRQRLQALTTQPAKPAGLVASGGGIAPPPLPDFSRYGQVDREPMNKIARVAAENLTVSWNVIPHVTQHDLADITDLEEARKRFGAGVGKNGPKVTMTAIMMKALTICLKSFPKFNSSLDPETNEIVYKRYYNIGCAVDTPNGLVVPVVKGCDQKSILDIAADITDLATKARDRKLSMDNMQGATCTVTNLGGIGGIGFTPIVNYPEVCILGMSRSQMQLALVDGKVVERMMLPLSLSYDHRVINGADAARFLVTLCNLLTDPFQLLTTV